MYLYILLLVSFTASLFLTLGWLKVAVAHKWFDFPNHRSSHSVPTPKSGGVGIALAYLILVFLLYGMGFLQKDWVLICCSGLLLAITGLVDDFTSLSIMTRLAFQFLAVGIAIYFLPVLPSLPFPGFELKNSAYIAIIVFVAWIWLINLYNFMDGIDALAAAEAIFLTLALAWFAGISGNASLSLLTLLLAAVLGGFLYFNLPPAKIFMGDSGSNFLGFLLGALGILAVVSGMLNLWTLLILFGVFIVDSTMTLFKRMWLGLVWYHGHRSHAYQLAASLHGSHAKVVLGISCINLFWLLPLAWISTMYASAGLYLTLLAWLPLMLIVRKYHDVQVGNLICQ